MLRYFIGPSLLRAALPTVNPRLRADEFLAQSDGRLEQAHLRYSRVQVQLVAGGTAFEASVHVGLQVHGEDAATR